MRQRTLLLASLAAVVMTTISGTAQTPSFSSKVESVRVDVLVTSGGKPVLGLKPGEFEVKTTACRRRSTWRATKRSR